MTPVALHPEPVDGEPLEARWVLPAGTLPFVGPVRRSPAELQRLVDEGVLTAVVVEPRAVRTRIAPERTWRGEGARVRDAVSAAAAAPADWEPVEQGDPDAVLRAAVEEVLEGDVGGYVRSHGGSLELVAVHNGRVDMRFSGACAHCPASDHTLTHRFESAVRERYPALAGIDTERTGMSAQAGPRFIGIPLLRRR